MNTAARSACEFGAGDRSLGSDRASIVWGWLAIVALSLAMLATLGRVAQLQLRPSERLRAFMGERVSELPDFAWRGDLLDRMGRPIAVSRVGQRAFIDPFRLGGVEPARRGEGIAALAEAIGMARDEVEQRVAERMRASEERVARGESPIRFARVGGLISEEQASRVRSLAIPGIHVERSEVREYTNSESSSRLVGIVGARHEGRLGAEFELDGLLRENDGSLRYLRDAKGRPLWVERGAWNAGENGRDVALSIDLELQRIAEEELWRGIVDSDAVGGRLVMIDPRSGEILAMTDLVRDVPGLVPYPWEPKDSPPSKGLPTPGPAGPRYVTLPPDNLRDAYPAGGRNRCVQDMYEPGSTFKPFVWAAVTQGGHAKLDEVFDTGNGFYMTPYGRSIEDVTRRPRMTWAEVLVNSSNIGMVKGADRMTPVELRRTLASFGFGQRTGIRLPGEMPGIMTSLLQWRKWTQTSVAFGHEVAVTPIQMVRAFSAFARTGELAGSLPELSLVRLDERDPSLDVVRRVVRPEVAAEVRGILTHVADKMEEVMERKDPNDAHWRYRIFGKSGTAEIPTGPPPEGYRRPTGSRGYFEEQYNSSFIAGGPYEDPRLVVLVVIDDPGPEHVFQPRLKRTHYGSHTAGPVVRRVLERSLSYLGVPASDPGLKIEIPRVNEW